MFDYDTLASGVRFDPEGTPPLYASLEVAGVPRNAPEPDFSQIKVERKWYVTDGKPWKPAPLKEGEALIVAVRVTTDRAMPDALLTDLLPAGMEVENFRSEKHTSELQSLMRISYAVFCLKKKTYNTHHIHQHAKE